MEATLSLGVLSLAFLTLTPLLAVGQKSARLSHSSRDTTQIAQTMIEEAKQGTLSSGTTYLDSQGNVANSTGAAYSAQSTLQSVAGSASLTKLTLLITPMGAPDRAQTYAIVFTTPQ